MEGMIAPKTASKNLKNVLFPAWAILTTVGLAVLGYLYINKKVGVDVTGDLNAKPGITYTPGGNQQQQQSQLSAEQQKVVDQVIARVKEIAKIEGNAIPSVARISNVETLKAEDTSGFYAAASNGDFLVMYPNVVFLYSPTEDKILKAAEIKTQATPLQEQTDTNQ